MIELPVAGDAGATAGVSDACAQRGGRAEQFYYAKVIHFKIFRIINIIYYYFNVVDLLNK